MKLYLITRRDLPPGAQLAQTAHGMAEYADKHPEKFKAWKDASNTVVCLAVKNEKNLRVLHELAVANDVAHAHFEEPDFGNALTSLVIDPEGAHLVKGLRCAG